MCIELFNQRGFSMKFKLFTYLFVFVFAVGFPTLGFSDVSEKKDTVEKEEKLSTANKLLGIGAIGAGVGSMGFATAGVIAIELGSSMPVVLPVIQATMGTLLATLGIQMCYNVFKGQGMKAKKALPL